MAVISVLSVIISVPPQVKLHESVRIIVDRAMNMITIAVPAALPAAMSVGVVFAMARLRAKNIFCISPPRINLAGQIDTFVFDKTGTLTAEGLTVLGFRPIIRGQDQNLSTFANFTDDATKLTPEADWWLDRDAEKKRNQCTTLLAEAMASCTAVTTVNGNLVGDPLDVQMF